MSTVPPNPAEEMQKIQQAFQQHRQELTEQLKQAYGLIQLGRAQDAYAAFEQAQHQVDTFYGAWEMRILQGMAVLGFADAWRQIIAQERVYVLWGLGSAAELVGKRDQARAAFKQALALIGAQPSVIRALLLKSSADLCLDDGLFDEAERLYRQACDDFTVFGLWEECVLALSSLADCAYARGDRDGFFQHLDEAIQLSKEHHLLTLQRDLQLKKYRLRMSTDPTGDTLQEVKQDKSLPQDVKAELFFEIGELKTAEEEYNQALGSAKDDPVKRSSILLSLASIHESCGQIREAIQSAEQALNITRTLGLQEATAQALQRLIMLRTKLSDPVQRAQAAQEMDELRQIRDPQYLVNALWMRALSYYQTKEFDLALFDLDEAERFAPTLELRRRLLLARTATLQAMGRQEDALATNLKAIELLNEQLASASIRSFVEWKDRLNEFAALHSNAAGLGSKLGRLREAFHWAEAGKAQLLRRQLEQARLQAPAAQTSEPSFDEVRTWLAGDSAALVMFCVSERETLMLVVDPSQSEPLALFVPLTEGELKALFPDTTVSPEKWNDIVFQALPTLSTKILPPLRDVIHRCKLLYLVPDSRLYSVPFAALTLDDGTHLIEHCALAYTPSATILKWCRSRRAEYVTRACLAVGVGKEKEYSFAEEAKAVAGEPGWAKSNELLEATAEQFLEQAPHYDVLHLSCHGLLESGILDTLSSSRLQFANRMLSAKEIFELGNGLHVQLVFLNACMSGGFHSYLRTEVGGFWQAFLNAGAASLVATLAYVHPGYARQLALAFYREWLSGGVTKAEALRRAQLAMLQQQIEPRYWACHILIGDHR
jgi:tetratricopeptide (TPR) repeat protein